MNLSNVRNSVLKEKYENILLGILFEEILFRLKVDVEKEAQQYWFKTSAKTRLAMYKSFSVKDLSAVNVALSQNAALTKRYHDLIYSIRSVIVRSGILQFFDQVHTQDIMVEKIEEYFDKKISAYESASSSSKDRGLSRSSQERKASSLALTVSEVTLGVGSHGFRVSMIDAIAACYDLRSATDEESLVKSLAPKCWPCGRKSYQSLKKIIDILQDDIQIDDLAIIQAHIELLKTNDPNRDFASLEAIVSDRRMSIYRQMMDTQLSPFLPSESVSSEGNKQEPTKEDPKRTSSSSKTRQSMLLTSTPPNEKRKEEGVPPLSGPANFYTQLRDSEIPSADLDQLLRDCKDNMQECFGGVIRYVPHDSFLQKLDPKILSCYQATVKLYYICQWYTQSLPLKHKSSHMPACMRALEALLSDAAGTNISASLPEEVTDLWNEENHSDDEKLETLLRMIKDDIVMEWSNPSRELGFEV